MSPTSRLPRSSRPRRRFAGALIVLGAMLPQSGTPAQSHGYNFVRIADTSQVAGVSGPGCVSVNAGGTVVFSSADGAVWRGDGTTLAAVAGPGAAGQPLAGRCPGVNDNGDVVYGFSSSSPAYTALVRNSGGAVTDLARSDAAPFLVLPGSTPVHSLTNAGSTMMTGADGMLYVMPAASPVYTLGPSDPPLSSVEAGTMNESGVVAFRARRDVLGVTRIGIYRGSGTPLVEEGTAAVPMIGTAPPAINGSGRVAFLARWPDGSARVLSTADGVTFVDHSGTIAAAASDRLSLNDSGIVVFATTVGGGNTGVFTGPDPFADKVVAPGDSLDGSTVVRAAVSYESLNDLGQIVFWAELADGRAGLYRADPLRTPIAADSTLSTVKNAPVSGALSASDPLNLPLTYAIVSNGTRGTAVIANAATGAFTYTPGVNSIGSDTFMFRAHNGSLDSNVATVSVTIGAGPSGNSAPVAQAGGSSPAAAVRFDGVGESLSRAVALPPIDRFTMMGWFRIIGDTTTYSSFLALGHATGTNTYRMLRCCGNGWQELDMANGIGAPFAGRLSTPVGAWYHLAMTVEGTGTGQLKTYINGVRTLAYNGNPNIPAQKLFIGNDGRGLWFNGSVAAVKVYDVPLTQAEIAAEMQQFAPVRTADLNGFYPLQSAATASTDFSGHDRALTVSGTLATDPNGPPIVAGTPLTTPEDTPLAGTLQASDAEGNPLTYAIVTNGAKGTAVVTDAASGAFTYTPFPDATGSDTVTFKANDGLVDSNVATITLLITPVNDAPVAADGTAAVTAGASVSGTLVATDSDGGSRTFAIVANGLKGTATVTNAATGAYTYTANAGTSGTDTFTFRANDGAADSNAATVTVSITASPNPVASHGALSVTEDTPAAGTLVATDPNGASLTYVLVTTGTQGTAAITSPATGAFTYTPNPNATGSDSFTFRATNGTHTSNTASVAVTIAAVNDAPIAANGSLSVMAGAAVTGTLGATDVDTTTRTFVIVTNGTLGTATISNAATGAFTYTAGAAAGSDTFTFRVSDGVLDSNIATVTVTVAAASPTNSPPVALPGGSGPAASVRFDSSSDELFSTTNLPSIGRFTIMGWFRFAADTNTYSTFFRLGHATTSNGYNLLRCCGGGWRELDLWNGSGIRTVGSLVLGSWHHLAVTVEGSGPGQVKTYVNGVLKLTSDGNPNVTANRLSIGNDAHMEWLDGNAAAVKIYDTALTAAEISQEMARLHPIRTSDLHAWYPLQSADTATADFSGNNRTLTQGGTLATDANGPPVDSGYSTPKNTTLSGALQATDPDGDQLTFSLSGPASHGTVTVNADGTFTYTPAAGFVGTDAFTFTVSDGRASATASVTITVGP